MADDHEPPILAFASASAWEEWLAENHLLPRGIWLRFAKKGSGIATVSYDEAVDVALCYGWIDGQRKSNDGDTFLQRFTPRRPRSLWSARNVAKVSGLIEAGRMRPPGLAEFEAARGDGRLEAAYDSPKDMVALEDLLAALEENERAKAFFGTLNKSARYSIAWRLHTAKRPETRARRLAMLIGTLERGETLR